MDRAALLAYARELDRQTVLVRSLLEGRGPRSWQDSLLAGEGKLKRKLSKALCREEGCE